MSSAGLFFATCKDAVRALNQNPNERTVSYEELYDLLVSGGVPGAYQARRYWRVPVEGLREVGYNPDTTYALHLNIRPEGVDHQEDYQSSPAANPVDSSVLTEGQIQQVIKEIEDRHDVDPLRKNRLELEHLVLLERENRELRLRLEESEKRAETAEAHLADLRSILDFATKPM